MASVSVQFHENAVCKGRAPDQQEECRANLAQALVPTKLSCLRSVHDLFVCQNPAGDSTKKAPHPCPKEQQLLAECLQTQLGPFGFSDDEVLKLLFGMKRPTPPEKPSLGVSEGGREKTGGGGEATDKENDTGGAKADRGDDGHGGKGKPNVEVEKESDKSGDGVRR
ncbi:unnamed protein product [Scytosiphon promiscuus]